jgi:AraC-like DNA-binding protein
VGFYDCFQVNCVLRGRIRLHVREHDIVLGPGDAYVLPWGCAPALEHGDEPFAAAYVSLYGTAGEYPDGFRGSVAALPPSNSLDALASLVCAEAQSPGPDSGLLLEHLGWSIAFVANRLRLAHSAEANQKRGAEYWAERVRQVIEGTVHSRRTLGDALADLPLSYRQLTRHFEKVIGCGPKDYQLACILRHARHLLRRTDLPVTVIALDLGFSSPQSFSTLFQRHVGVPPTVFRRQSAEADASSDEDAGQGWDGTRGQGSGRGRRGLAR